MPVQLRIVGTALHLEKTKHGSHPFTAEIALGDIASVTAGRATVMPTGATLHLKLRDDTEVLLQLHLPAADAAALAKVIEDRASASPSAEPPAGIVVTSPAP